MAIQRSAVIDACAYFDTWLAQRQRLDRLRAGSESRAVRDEDFRAALAARDRIRVGEVPTAREHGAMVQRESRSS